MDHRFYLYPPPRRSTFFVEETFPQVHYPFEQTYHRVGEVLHSLRHPCQNEEINCPRIDVRETTKKYYIEVELPGLTTTDDLTLVWANRKTLSLKATIKRPILNENDEESPLVAEGTTDKNEKENPIHFLCNERRLGQYTRSFVFLAAVDHDAIRAEAKDGLLRIVVPKWLPEHQELRNIEVDRTSTSPMSFHSKALQSRGLSTYTDFQYLAKFSEEDRFLWYAKMPLKSIVFFALHL